jgi:hypothetical protein
VPWRHSSYGSTRKHDQSHATAAQGSRTIAGHVACIAPDALSGQGTRGPPYSGNHPGHPPDDGPAPVALMDLQ